MYFVQTVPYQSKPRVVPMLGAIALYAGLVLAFANGLGVIHVAERLKSLSVVDIPNVEKPQPASEMPRIDLQAFTSGQVVTLDEPIINIGEKPIVVGPPDFQGEREQRIAPQEFPLVAARLLRKFDPPYPPQSRRLDEQGVVMLRLTILPNGRVANAQIEHSSGYPRLDRAAMEAAQQWLFAPAKRGDQPVTFVVTAPIRFDLKKTN